MHDPKPFASLSPTLLARKGAARPAMRPQLHPLHQFHETPTPHSDDLGWNDMGHEPAPSPPVSAPAKQPVVLNAEVVPLKGPVQADPPAPPVVRERETLAATIARLDRPRRSALAEGRRAAFTLRLDAERHLQLRLACTIENRSAQQLVTEALDHLLADMPEVSTLAERVRKRR